MLTLNAALEAVRTGEQEKECAFVANEVGKLTEESSDSTKNKKCS